MKKSQSCAEKEQYEIERNAKLKSKVDEFIV
jgi:hypothetical protein